VFALERMIGDGFVWGGKFFFLHERSAIDGFYWGIKLFSMYMYMS